MTTKTRKNINYTDEPLGEFRIVDDFLPSPERLAFKESSVKIIVFTGKQAKRFSSQTYNSI